MTAYLAVLFDIRSIERDKTLPPLQPSGRVVPSRPKKEHLANMEHRGYG